MSKSFKKLIPPTLLPVVIKTLTVLGFLQRDTFRKQRLDLFIESRKGIPLPDREKEFKQELLIPCHNHGRFLPALLDSLRGKDLDVTIINDASTDETASIIESLQKSHSFKLITNETNLRQFGSLNKAVEQSRNNLFTVLNADDFLIPNWVDYVKTIFSNTNIFLLGGDRIQFQNDVANDLLFAKIVCSIAHMPARMPNFFGPKDAAHFSNDNSIDMTMSGCSFLKSAWSFVGGYFPREQRTSLWDDRDFQMRVCAFFEIGISPEVSAFYRTNSSLGTGTC